MTHEKYLYWFRLQFPIDWINEKDHEVIGLVFIIANTEADALSWGNKLAEKYIEDLFAENNYQTEKISFSSFIWEDWEGLENLSSESRKELENSPIVNFGEFTELKFEIFQ